MASKNILFSKTICMMIIIINITKTTYFATVHVHTLYSHNIHWHTLVALKLGAEVLCTNRRPWKQWRISWLTLPFSVLLPSLLTCPVKLSCTKRVGVWKYLGFHVFGPYDPYPERRWVCNPKLCEAFEELCLRRGTRYIFLRPTVTCISACTPEDIESKNAVKF